MTHRVIYISTASPEGEAIVRSLDRNNVQPGQPVQIHIGGRVGIAAQLQKPKLTDAEACIEAKARVANGSARSINDATLQISREYSLTGYGTPISSATRIRKRCRVTKSST